MAGHGRHMAAFVGENAAENTVRARATMKTLLKERLSTYNLAEISNVADTLSYDDLLRLPLMGRVRFLFVLLSCCCRCRRMSLLTSSRIFGRRNPTLHGTPSMSIWYVGCLVGTLVARGGVSLTFVWWGIGRRTRRLRGTSTSSTFTRRDPSRPNSGAASGCSTTRGVRRGRTPCGQAKRNHLGCGCTTSSASRIRAAGVSTVLSTKFRKCCVFSCFLERGMHGRSLGCC